jgi:hypothetical protein
MQCSKCGYERPRTGDCPNCGAPPPGASSYSSLRSWREQASSPGGSRTSRPNPDDQRPISRPVSGDPSRSRGGSGANWRPPDQSYPRRGGDPNQSYPRRGGDPNQSYPRRGGDPSRSYAPRGGQGGDDYGVDDERALMVAPDLGALMAPADDRALPALPTEEEERALGIRRPAFIPATDERKGKKAGRWRVVSGVLSIMLLCVGMCGVSGLLVQHNVIPGLSKLLGLTRPGNVRSVPLVNIPTAYAPGTPLVTPVPGPKTPIQDIRSYNLILTPPNNSTAIPKNPTDLFTVGQTVYVVMDLNSTVKANDTVSVKWLFNSVDVTSEIQKLYPDCCAKTVSQTGKQLQVIFGIKPPTTGFGEAHILYNNQPAYIVLFEMIPATQTPTPGAATSTPASH